MGLSINPQSLALALVASGALGGSNNSNPFSASGSGKSSCGGGGDSTCGAQSPLSSLLNQSSGLGANSGCSQGGDQLKNFSNLLQACKNGDAKGICDSLKKLTNSASGGKESPARQLSNALEKMQNGNDKNSLQNLLKNLGQNKKSPMAQMKQALKAMKNLQSDNPIKQALGLASLANMGQNGGNGSTCGQGGSSLGGSGSGSGCGGGSNSSNGLGSNVSNALTAGAYKDLSNGNIVGFTTKLDLAARLKQEMQGMEGLQGFRFA
jgi:hypothetical protein